MAKQQLIIRNEQGQFLKGTIPWNKRTKGLMNSWNKNKTGVYSEETLKKMSNSLKGRTAWNKGKKNSIKSWNKGKKNCYSEETLKKMSLSHIGKPAHNKNQITKKCIICNKEFSCCPSEKKHICCSKECRSISRRNKLLNNKYAIITGTSKLDNKLRQASKYKIWRELIFLRDNFICQNPNCKYCNNQQGVMLIAHHIKSFTKYPELRLDINNGITYCKEYHIYSGLHKRNKLKMGDKYVI